MPTLLQARGLGHGPLGPLDLTLEEGECLALRGPSGAGKTLLLRALADLDPVDGSVALAGVPRDRISGPDWRLRVGYVPAEPGWWTDDAAAHLRDAADAAPLLARLGLDEGALSRPVSRLSTGERQRIAVVRALQPGPLVLLLDEPTAALDHDATVALEALIAERRGDGLGVVWVTHDAGQAARVASRTLTLASGRPRPEASA